MDISQVKTKLLDNPDLLVYLLEKLGCEKIIDKYRDQIRCALPNGENPTSIRVKLDDNISCAVFSRSNFKGGDIFSLIQYIKNISFKESLEWVSQILNIGDIDYIPQKHSQTYDFFRLFKNRKVSVLSEHNILSKNILDKYPKYICQDWIDEGINKKTQEKYDIHYDKKSLDGTARIVYPIRNDIGEIINIKGRTCDPDYKIHGIRKYTYYYPVGKFDILFGLYFNYSTIIKENKLIIVEAEKSVMKFDSLGIYNVIAICTHSLSTYQLKKILSLHCKSVILALDKDVTYEEIKEISNKLKIFLNVYIIKDKNNLLNEKDSPIDKGIGIWNKLYTEKILIK